MWGLGLKRRDKSSLDKPWGGPALMRKLDRSELKVEVGSWYRLVYGPTGQLALSHGKIVILVQDDHGEG